MNRAKWTRKASAALVAGMFAAASGAAAAQEANTSQQDTSAQANTSSQQGNSPAQQAQQGRQQGQQVAQAQRRPAVLSRSVVRKIQRSLNREGYNAGPVDGYMGPQTRAGIRAYQEDNGIKTSGQLDEQTLAGLGFQTNVASAQPQQQQRGSAEFAAGETKSQRIARQLYFGGGIGFNSADGYDNAIGGQVFLGWKPNRARLGNIQGALEVGYMNSGSLDQNLGAVSTTVEGLWATVVGTMPIKERWNALARVGADFGDDDGLMWGIGVGHDLGKTLDLRAEYVVRDHVDSIQLNAVWRPY